MNKLLSIFALVTTLAAFSIQGNAQLAGSGNSYDFSSSYISAPNNASLNSSFITLEAWIKADSWATNIWENVIISKDGWASGEQGYTLRSGANGSLSFNIGVAGAWQEVSSGPLMALGQWYHVAGTYDGTTMRIYINAEEVNTFAYSGVIASSTYALNIGKIAYTAGGFRYFDGMIDEVRVWTAAVPQSSIQDYMCKKVTATHPQYASLGGYWNFDDVGTILDSSPNTNDASTTGSTQVISGAPIGDESIHSYAGPFDLTLGIPALDSVQVESLSAAQTIHIYRVDMQPTDITTGPGIDSMDYSHYYGVFVGANAPYTYDLSYHYSANPIGISNEANLELTGRTDGTVSPWTAQGSALNAPVDEVDNTYSNRTEVMLGITCTQVNLSTAGSITICAGDTVNSFDLAVNSNYQWHDGSGPIVLETTNSIDLVTTGDYYLVANTGVCADTSNTINLVVNPLPLVDFGTAPNPGSCENDADFTITGSTPAGGFYGGTGVTGSDFSPSTAGPGSYWITYTYTDGSLCTNSDSMLFTVYAQPATPIITANADILCVASSGVGTIYNWELDGIPVASSTDTCYVALANGNYTVVCVPVDGCISEPALQVIDFIGIEEFDWSSEFSITPNPTSGIVQVTLPATWTTELFITIMDMEGRKLQTRSTTGGTIEFNLAHYDAGIYFFVLESGDERLVKRILKN
jgi:hypothetical protein